METKKCTFCGEIVKRSKFECPSCKRHEFELMKSPTPVRESNIGRLLREEAGQRPAEVKPVDPIEKLSQQIERSIEAQNRTTTLILFIAEFVFSISFWTLIFIWNITRQLRDNPDAHLYFSWITYLAGLGFFTIRARQKLFEFNLKSK